MLFRSNESDPEHNNSEKVSIEINGGEFKKLDGQAEGVVVNSDSNVLTICGGTFDTNPSSYLANNYIAKLDNGKYIVEILKSRTLTADEKNKIDSSNLYVSGLEVYYFESGEYSIGSFTADKMIFIPDNNVVILDLAGNIINSTFDEIGRASCRERV